MWKTTPITLIFLAAMMPCLDPPGVLSFSWNFGNTPVIFGSAILGFLLQWSGALVLGNMELLTNALDHENWSLVQFFMLSSYSRYGTSSLQQVKKFTNDLEIIIYDLREEGLRGLEEGGTVKEIEFMLYCFCIFFQFLVLEFELEIYFAFEY
ncbi:hypothetical protein AAHE18_02G091400 [Arachis hypogaea]|nr:Putative membrane protein [Arachis hypogaea]